jgi:hypothetical protein
MLACLCCRAEWCRSALSESDSENDGNPYRSVITLGAEARPVSILFDDVSLSDSLEDDVYYDHFVVAPRQSAQQCTVMLRIARQEANEALIGPVTEQQLESITLTYEQAIGASEGSLKRKMIREYDRVLARFGPVACSERASADALQLARCEQLPHDERCQAYRKAIRATIATKKALKKEYNGYLLQTRARH